MPLCWVPPSVLTLGTTFLMFDDIAISVTNMLVLWLAPVRPSFASDAAVRSQLNGPCVTLTERTRPCDPTVSMRDFS